MTKEEREEFDELVQIVYELSSLLGTIHPEHSDTIEMIALGERCGRCYQLLHNKEQCGAADKRNCALFGRG